MPRKKKVTPKKAQSFDETVAKVEESQAVDTSRNRNRKPRSTNEYRYVGQMARTELFGLEFERDKNRDVSSLTPTQILQLAGNPFFQSAESKVFSPDIEYPDPAPLPKPDEGEQLADKFAGNEIS